MNCNQVREFLPLLLYGDLSAEEAAVTKHFATCPACQKEYAALQKLRGLLDAEPAPSIKVNLGSVYAEAARRQEVRLRRWRRATYALVGVAAMLFIIFGLKLEVHVQAHQLIVRWNAPEQNIDSGARDPMPDAPALAKLQDPASPVTADDIRRMSAMIHALYAYVDARDKDQHEIVTSLGQRLEKFQYGDNERWKATQRDLSNLITVCLGTREGDKGAKP
ncbi:MAG: anti-sigma factor family protein [Gemmataceae bacterium]